MAFGGFLLIAAGGLAIAGFQFTAADTAGDVPATVTQALAALNRDFFFLLDGGVLIAVFATAAATLRHAPLPRWYGYLSIAVGLIFLTRPSPLPSPPSASGRSCSRCSRSERRGARPGQCADDVL